MARCTTASRTTSDQARGARGCQFDPSSRSRPFSRRLGAPTRRAPQLGLAPSWWGAPSARPDAWVGTRLVPHAVYRPLCARLDVEPGRVGSGPIAGAVRRRRRRGSARTSEADRSRRTARRRGAGPSLIGRAPTRTPHGPADIMLLVSFSKSHARAVVPRSALTSWSRKFGHAMRDVLGGWVAL